jgi:phospholipase/carboxylesterase
MPGVADILFRGVDPARAKVLCIFVHGRNQSPEEMEAAVIRRLSARDVAFALPRAGERTWYHARAVDPLTDATRAELSASMRGLGRQSASCAPVRLAGRWSLQASVKAPALPSSMLSAVRARRTLR